MIEVGRKVPSFALEAAQGGQEVRKFKSSELKGQYSVIYFYPKDSTPGCTTQAEEFSKLSSQFEKKNAKVYGVSRDSIASHEKFIEKKSLKIPLLSDSDGLACELFDVLKEKNMYGRKSIGIERSTFLVGPDLKLIKEWRKVKAQGHAKVVLEAIKDL